MGCGGDFAICDDLNSADDVLSDTLRKATRAIRDHGDRRTRLAENARALRSRANPGEARRSRRARRSESGHSRPILRDPSDFGGRDGIRTHDLLIANEEKSMIRRGATIT
jgi:hypothetical protein